MALTLVEQEPPIPGGRHRAVDVTVALDADYPAGGYVLNAGQFGLSTVTGFDDVIGEGWVARCDTVSYPPRLQVYGMNATTANMEEATPGEDFSGIDTLRLRLWGW